MKLLLAIILISLSQQAQALVGKDGIELKPIGSAQFYWTFFKIYDITLYNENGQYQAENYPIALKIKYARNITNNELIESTKKQWQLQNIDWKPEWILALKEIWPNVSEDDEILLYIDHQSVSHFYFNTQVLGLINDPDFATNFLSIWLSEKTSQPQLRQQLLGLDL